MSDTDGLARRYLVTGASRGLGSVVAASLGAGGAEVVGTVNASRDSAAELRLRCPNITFLPVDLADRVSVSELTSQLRREQPLNGIVHNAGVISFEPWNTMSTTTWDHDLEVNVHSVVAITHALKDNIADGGSIVIIAGLDAFAGSYASIAYAAAQAARVSITRSLAVTLAPRVRVNCLCLGWMVSGMTTPEAQRAARISPLARNGDPNELARVVTYLLFESSALLTGSTVIMDGGYLTIDQVRAVLALDEGSLGR